MMTTFQLRPRKRTAHPTLNKFVHDFFNSSFTDIVDREFVYTRPAVNVVEKENAFELSFAAPGLKKDLFSIEVENDVLTICANKPEADHENVPNYKSREFDYAGFKRSFKLDPMFNTSEITASYEAGILMVIIPKAEKKVKKINIG